MEYGTVLQVGSTAFKDYGASPDLLKEGDYITYAKYANNILTGSRSGQITEGDSEASLVPIFTGVRPPQESKVAPSPAQTAMTALQRLQAQKGIAK